MSSGCLQDVFRMSSRCPYDVFTMSSGMSSAMSSGFLQNVFRVSLGQDDFRMTSG